MIINIVYLVVESCYLREIFERSFY